jgi:uncharacterized cupredoxin-like copper-binding protein
MSQNFARGGDRGPIPPDGLTAAVGSYSSGRLSPPAAARPFAYRAAARAMARERTRLVGLLVALVCAMPLAAAPAPKPATTSAVAKVDWSKAKRIDVVMVEYKFVPDHLSFRRGVAYRLHLENQGKELHEFTAPEFFAAVTLRDPKVLWTGGQEVVVQPGASVDVDLVPLRAGHYDLKCEDHDWAGMIGEIDVQ